MALLPSARLSIDDAAGAFGSGSVIIAVCAPVPGVAAVEATLFGSTTALLEEHGYSQGVAYSALHYDETKLPVLFCAMPVAVAGAISSVDHAGVAGAGRVTVTAGDDGVLDAVEGTMTFLRSGTAGTDNMEVELSLDGGHNTKNVRFGTATSYTVPHLGLVIGITGDFEEDDVVTFRSTGPKWDASGATAIRTALAEKNVQVRTWLFIGDADTEAKADAVRAAAEAYATSNDRFIRARIQARDQYRDGGFADARGRTVGAALTFAEVGATGDTITRAAGSWVTDGFAVGDVITITGTASNNVTGPITAVTATVLTMGSTDLTAEVTSAGTVEAAAGLTFAEVGATGDTITRSSGSWVADGFVPGMTITVDGSASNDGEYTLSAVSATVLTLADGDLVDEAGVGGVVVDGVESNADWRTDITEEYEDLSGDEARRLDIGAGYGAKLCPITGWRLRRPVSWAASLREYKHDVHIPNWRVADGALGGWTLEDANKRLVEHDERVDGGLLAGNFTCFRTWNNEDGVFIALSLTRANPGSMLSRSHNMDVANVACTTIQRSNQREVGQVLVLQRGTNGQPSSGKATEASLQLLESRANAALALELEQEIVTGEGPRASRATWQASRDDVLNVPGATLTGVLTLELNGTIEHVSTSVKVPTFGG